MINDVVNVKKRDTVTSLKFSIELETLMLIVYSHPNRTRGTTQTKIWVESAQLVFRQLLL